MTTDDTMRILYLVLLGAAVIGWFITQNRQALGKTLQGALIWVFLFLGVIAGYGLWDDIRGTVTPRQAVIDASGTIEVPRSRDGHYHLTLQVNDKPVEFVVDTGASGVVLTMGDARRVGIDTKDLPFIGRANTANGTVRTAPVRLDSVQLGDHIDRNVPASVNEGEMFQSLLGMSYLQTWTRIEIADGKLILRR